MRPVVRLFVACWSGVPGAPVMNYTLADMKSVVRAKPGVSYPIIHPEFCFFAWLAGGRGIHQFVVQQRRGVGPAEELVAHSRTVTVDMGSDPLRVRGLTIRLQGIPFRQPGQYEFVLLCDGLELEPTIYIDARA